MVCYIAEIGCPKYTWFALFLGFCFHISPQMIHPNDPLTQARNSHTHTYLFIYKHTQQCLYLAALVYTEDRAIVEPLATSSIRQTSCYKNNIRKPRTIRVRSNITISFGFLAIESPITDCPRSPGISLPFLVRIFPKVFPLFVVPFFSHSQFWVDIFLEMSKCVRIA